ncbi:MAG: hypothetical protein WC624_04620, partial [Candidatus Margulisiibacteriota bacterium]
LQFHHIFPKSLLSARDVEKKEINELANMAFIGGKTNRQILNKAPIDYFDTEVIAKRGEDSLTSQLIPIDKELWKLDSYNAFLKWRRKAIADEINKFMKQFESA